MEAKVTWQKNLVFTGTAESGFELPWIQESVEEGKEMVFNPWSCLPLGWRAVQPWM